MATEIKVGDVLHLISGGPDMTVAEITPATQATSTMPAKPEVLECWWFVDGDNTLHKAVFPVGAVHVEAEAPPAGDATSRRGKKHEAATE